MTYTDDILQAYLTGSLESDAAAALEQAVADDPALEARLMALDPFAAPVAQAFSDIPSDDRLKTINLPAQMPETTSTVAPLLRYAAAGVVGLVLGYGVFQATTDTAPAPTGWKAQVAAYQVLYVAETVQNISSTDEELATQFSNAEDQLGLDLQREVLSTIPNLDLKRAQILGFNGKPLIQIAFEGENGTPIALCIIRSSKGTKELGSEMLAGLASASWANDTHAFLLIGGSEQDAISATARNLTEVF